MSPFKKFSAHRRAVSWTAAMSLGAVVFSGGLVLVDSGPALANDCPAPVEPSGQGSTLEPYIIDSAAKLAWVSGRDFSTTHSDNFANLLRLSSGDDDLALEARMGANYRQSADIDMGAYLDACEGWLSIGSLIDSADNSRVRFRGVYDGENFAIRSFSTTNLSLFGDIRSGSAPAPRAEVKDLRLVGVNGTSFQQRGILARVIENADIENVHLDGGITVGGSNQVGGFANEASGDSVIRESSSDLRISSSAPSARRQHIGGIVNELKGTSKILSSSSTGSFTEISSVSGGLVARTEFGTLISRSWSSVSIAGNGNELGGLVGAGRSAIRYSYAKGNVTNTNTDQAGGLVGQITVFGDPVERFSQISDSYARGQVSVGGGTGRAGGLLGDLRSPSNVVERSFATRAPVGLISVGTGALLGSGGDLGDLEDLQNLRANFFDSSSSGGLLGVARTSNSNQPNALERVAGLPTAQLQSFATFDGAGWAIVDGWAPFNAPDDGNPVQGTHQVWGICSGVNDGFPFLLWEYTSSPCISGSSGALSSPGVVSSAIHLDLKATAGDVVTGGPVLIEGQGLQPGSAYLLVMRSTPVTITTGTVSSGGRFSTTVNLPAGIAPGNHTITLTAIGSDGSTLSLVTTFVVSGAGTFTSISPGLGSVVGGLAATGPNSSALSLGVASSLALLALGLAAYASSRRNAAQV